MQERHRLFVSTSVVKTKGLLLGIVPTGPGHCALPLAFTLSFSLSRGISGASPSPPIERVARGRRAPAAGLCARPGSRLGPYFVGFYCRSGRGGRPEIGPRRSVASPFFVQHAGERTDHSSSGPRHQLSHSWCLGGQDLVQRPQDRLHCPATPCPGTPGPTATVH